MPCTMQTERAETQPVGGLGWEMGAHLGNTDRSLSAGPAGFSWVSMEPPSPAPPCITALSIGGWLLLCIDYSLKCLLSPMPPHTAEIPFPSNEVSAGVLERRKAFN